MKLSLDKEIVRKIKEKTKKGKKLMKKLKKKKKKRADEAFLLPCKCWVASKNSNTLAFYLIF